MKLKHLYQKLTRGFSDDEIWSLDATISKFTLPRLKYLRSLYDKEGIVIGIPHRIYVDFEIFDAEEEAGLKKWLEILDEMIWFHEQTISFDVLTKNVTRYKIAASYWGRYYDGLWW